MKIDVVLCIGILTMWALAVLSADKSVAESKSYISSNGVIKNVKR
jgi:hypothetical protein